MKLIFSVITLGAFFLAFMHYRNTDSVPLRMASPVSPQLSPSPAPTRVPSPPPSYLLTGGTQVYQTFNNCGPASLSMALSYYGLNVSQQEIGNTLRPWQNPQGDNDDKSVTLEELAHEAGTYGLIPFHRPAGSRDIIRQAVSRGYPVITRTWLKPADDIGHYRVIKGFDHSGIIQDDSLQGKDLRYTWEEFDVIWGKFNYEYLVLLPTGREAEVDAILGQDTDEHRAWSRAAEISASALEDSPGDPSAGLNLSVAKYRLGDYEGSVEEFEKVESRLPARALWYQIEPIRAYFELKEYSRVMDITGRILENNNRAFSELYILRGHIFRARGENELARAEYEKAVLYNRNLDEAHQALQSLQ